MSSNFDQKNIIFLGRAFDKLKNQPAIIGDTAGPHPFKFPFEFMHFQLSIKGGLQQVDGELVRCQILDADIFEYFFYTLEQKTYSK